MAKKTKPARAPKGEPTTQPAGGAAKDDEIVTVPRGRNRFQFLFLIGLMVFLLIIFLVPGALMGTFLGSQGVAEYMVWDHPRLGRQTLSQSDFYEELRRFEFALRNSAETEEAAAQLIIHDVLSREAGVEVSDAELAASLRREVEQRFGGSVEAYRNFARSQFGSVEKYEENQRLLMRIDRYRALLGHAASVPGPEAIEEAWNREHVEHAFDYVEVPAADFTDEARGALPGDEELEAWFDALGEDARAELRVPDRYAVEVVRWDVGEAAPDALLAAHPQDPEPADGPGEEAGDAAAGAEEATSVARRYYDAVQYSRFRRAEALPEDPEDTSPEASRARYYEPFEEVREAAAAEGPVYFAMRDWLADVRARIAEGEEVDLAAEAERLGLEHHAADEPRSLAEWRELAEVSGALVAPQLGLLTDGELGRTLLVDRGSFVVPRLVEKVPAHLPEFAAIRDEVADAWVEERSGELAVEALSAVRESLAGGEEGADGAEPEGEAPDGPVNAGEEAFRAAAEEAGFEVRRRGWIDRGDRDAIPAEEQTDADRYLASASGVYELDEGEVAPPALDPSGERAYLVRSLGSREVPLDRMTPADHARYVQTARFLNRQLFASNFLSSQDLAQRYGLRFQRAEPEEGGEPR